MTKIRKIKMKRVNQGKFLCIPVEGGEKILYSERNTGSMIYSPISVPEDIYLYPYPDGSQGSSGRT
jgi:hypothetical protein